MASLLRTLAPLAAFPWAVSAFTLSSLRGHAAMDSKWDGRLSGERGFCAPVIDEGAMGLIDIEVGSNNTKLSLVVDTGSNVLIVESCECQAAGVCPATEKCVNVSTSSSFQQLALPSGEGRNMTLHFGSGLIKGHLGLDDITVGGATVSMSDGMLFMVDRALDFKQGLEGILGLGPSSVIIKHARAAAQAETEKRLQEMGKKANLTNATEYDKKAYEEALGQFAMAFNDANPEPRGFLEQANQRRFALCFGKGNDTNGTLVVGGEPAEQTLTSIGMLHWGLALEGVYVRNSTVMFQPPSMQDAHGVANVSASRKALKNQGLEKTKDAPRLPLCSRQANMTEGQKTPCGVIPDSGTTALAMPQAHLNAVAEAICENWDRCLNNFTALGRAKKAAEEAAIDAYGILPFKLPELSKAEVLKFVLADCANYNKSLEDVVAEMPDIQLMLGDGTTSNLLNVSIPAPSYVFEVDVNQLYAAYYGALDPNMTSNNKTAEPQMACALGLQASEFNTVKNGDVWILGKPLFHEYHVHYDIGDNTIGFTSTEHEPCGTCHAGAQNKNRTAAEGRRGLGLLSPGAPAERPARLRNRAPRRIRGGFRPPRIDTTQPL